jgi:hypothetical protein
MENCISPKEAGAIVGRTARTIILWAETGKIIAFKLGGQWEINVKSLNAYIEKCMEKYE